MCHIPLSVINKQQASGGVTGVAILGALVGDRQAFIPGMHLAFAIAGGVLVLALGTALVYVRKQETPRLL